MSYPAVHFDNQGPVIVSYESGHTVLMYAYISNLILCGHHKLNQYRKKCKIFIIIHVCIVMHVKIQYYKTLVFEY